MDYTTFDSLVVFIAAVVVPLLTLGLFAAVMGADSRDLQHDASTATPWKW